MSKTSHGRRTCASRVGYIEPHTFLAGTGFCTLHQRQLSGSCRAPRQRRWFLSLPVASQENLSSCIPKFLDRDPSEAQTEIGNTRHGRGECGHIFGCWAKLCRAPSKNVPAIMWRPRPSAHATHHAWSRRLAQLLSGTCSLSLQCPSLHLRQH